VRNPVEWRNFAKASLSDARCVRASIEIRAATLSSTFQWEQ
jgi:hypothetical protein